jgi:hypothetical protein
MKRLILIVLVSLLSVAIIAQGKIGVPALTDLQKYQNAAIQWNASWLIQISFAKSLGKSVGEVAGFVGDQVKVTFNTAGGFNRFVQGMLYTMVSLVPYGSVEIIQQTDNEIVYKVTGLYPDLREGGSLFNVTWDDYLKFLETVYSKTADYIGAKYSQKDTDEGLLVTIMKE